MLLCGAWLAAELPRQPADGAGRSAAGSRLEDLRGHINIPSVIAAYGGALGALGMVPPDECLLRLRAHSPGLFPAAPLLPHQLYQTWL